ncbi:MAG: sugar phosphate isomerase/epimerase [Thermodesulfobacteriota bacterium]|nr:sugar phosphate isomerase/epimerase [Thermodesulfobacteriota bacterium]
MLGISTCWWNGKSFRGDEIVREALDLGFQGVELEYRITTSVYQQMRPQLKKAMAVLSLHNVFPKPEDPAFGEEGSHPFLLSATDRDTRAMAVKYAMRTIAHANDLEAPVVVLHLGRVDMENPTERFKTLHKEGTLDQSAGRVFVDKQRHIRDMTRQKNLDAVLFSLERLNREAEEKGVLLGLENRYHFYEIPNGEEVGTILREFEGGSVRYWHDVGHAAVQERLGICLQEELLETHSKKMIGCHIHDVRGLEDHLSPGQGDMDFRQLAPRLKSASIKILEIHSKVEKGDLLKGLALIKAHLATHETLP